MEKDKKTTFKAGDLVHYYPYGDRIFQLKKNSRSENLPLQIDNDDITESFTEDGKGWNDHVKPLLTHAILPNINAMTVEEFSDFLTKYADRESGVTSLDTDGWQILKDRGLVR